MNSYTVYYKKHDRIGDVGDNITPKEMTRGYFDSYYRAVTDITVEDLEEVYIEMQGEKWSPNGEARELISSLGLSHTSMSTGDIAFCHNDGKYYYCSWVGWDEITLTN
jgi:hypothetical protein